MASERQFHVGNPKQILSLGPQPSAADVGRNALQGHQAFFQLDESGLQRLHLGPLSCQPARSSLLIRRYGLQLVPQAAQIRPDALQIAPGTRICVIKRHIELAVLPE
jgi:hypothetical protein